MKKQMLFKLSGLLPAIVLFTNLNAQTFKSSRQFHLDETAFNEAMALPVIPVTIKDDNTTHVNARALKDFAANFKKADKVDWLEVKDGYVARFEMDGVQTKAYYSQKGRWNATVYTYDQFKLPTDVRKLVRSTYYDFDIFVAHEVKLGDKTVYLVKIQDQQTLKTIRVADGEMDVYEDFVKDKRAGF